MFKAGIKVKFLLDKYNLIFPKTYWLLLIAISINFYSSPVYAQDSHSIAINQNNLNRSITIKGASGGSIRALEIIHTGNTSTGYCDGFANHQPNHVLKIDTFWQYLRLEVKSRADTTILVKGAGGVWCNDDAGSANPIIEGQWQPGVYQVWVGSYQANSHNKYKIKITGK